MSEKKATTRYLKVTFEKEETILSFAKEAAELARQLEEAEAGKKAAASDFKARIDRLNAEISLLARKVRDGHEYRNVECCVTYDWKAGKKLLERTDTLEAFVEPITADERQQRLVA